MCGNRCEKFAPHFQYKAIVVHNIYDSYECSSFDKWVFQRFWRPSALEAALYIDPERFLEHLPN